MPIAPDGVISQFEGYRDLAELDWADYRRRYGDIQRLDRILEAEGRSVDDYQVAKQADVLMLFYLLSADELRELLERLGYALPPEAIPRTIEYYLARTSRGSTLSALVGAWVLARGDRERALEHFERALRSDIADIQGGTTAEGVHLGAMAGCVDLLQRCFAGRETRHGALWFNPHWPHRFGRLEFAVQYRGQPLTVRVSGREVRVSAEPGPGRAVRIGCGARCTTCGPGRRCGSSPPVPRPRRRRRSPRDDRVRDRSRTSAQHRPRAGERAAMVVAPAVNDHDSALVTVDNRAALRRARGTGRIGRCGARSDHLDPTDGVASVPQVPGRLAL